MAQSFYVWRIWNLTRNYWTCIIIECVRFLLYCICILLYSKGVLDCCYAMHCGVLCRNCGEIVLGAVLLITIVDH